MVNEGGRGALEASLSAQQILFTQTGEWPPVPAPPGWPLPGLVWAGGWAAGIRFPSDFTYLNLGEVRDTGIELGIDGSINDNWGAFANYAFRAEPVPEFPNLTEEETKRLDYSLLDYDRTHNFTVNAIYQLPMLTQSKALGVLVNEWQISGVYRWTSGRPYTVGFSIPGVGAANLTGTDGNPNARIALTCDPGKGWSGDPYRQFDTSCFAPPQPDAFLSVSAICVAPRATRLIGIITRRRTHDGEGTGARGPDRHRAHGAQETLPDQR